MRKRTGDWRDLLSAYALALDAKKIFLGFIAVLGTVLIMVVATGVYTPAEAGAGFKTELGEFSLLSHFMRGTGCRMLCRFLVYLNPFHGGLVHFVVSVLIYGALMAAWSGAAGGISRLAALEYARDDLPTLDDARAMVRPRRKSYFLAPLMPLVVIVLLTALNALGGLVASIPVIGRILLIPGWPLLLATTTIIAFLAVFGILSFGLMMPAVSVEGKDAFESWSTAYSYVLWGLRRFICYTLLVGVIGVIAAVVAWALGELVIYLIYKTVHIGFVHGVDWLSYSIQSDAAEGFRIEVLPAGTGFNYACSIIMVALMLLIRAVPAAYVFSYFFTAGTITYFLMRKDQDNIAIDEIYEEAAEEEGAEGLQEEAIAEEPEAPEEEGPPGEPEEPEEEAPAAEEEAEEPDEEEAEDEPEEEQ
ncbi:MAG: hypothetical protein AMK73_00600 [Planctomycetes bacterium SM23_32]|nr:MAG: hypothetical protein AMK73_00600 [Planctomycetes bacterium SM23_32]